jgi:four helix bundle protein
VDQIRRASASVQNNIAEGFERGSRAEFAKALTISKASAGEVRSMLYNALDFGYISPNVFEELMMASQEVSRLVAAQDSRRTTTRCREVAPRTREDRAHTPTLT